MLQSNQLVCLYGQQSSARPKCCGQIAAQCSVRSYLARNKLRVASIHKAQMLRSTQQLDSEEQEHNDIIAVVEALVSTLEAHEAAAQVKSGVYVY
jgi:hypothetical protein